MTDLAAPPTVTARLLLVDLEADGVDPAVVALVRHELKAIAKEVRKLPVRVFPVEPPLAWIARRGVLDLIEPGERT